MYVNSRGMGALNCPGDPGCPGYVAPGSPEWQNSMLEAILGNQIASGAVDSSTSMPVDPGMSTPAASGLGISGRTLLFAGAGLFGLVLIMKAVR